MCLETCIVCCEDTSCRLYLTCVSLPTGVQAARAMCAGCAASRLRQRHIGKLTHTTGMSHHHVMVAHMMHAWTKQEWRGDASCHMRQNVLLHIKFVGSSKGGDYMVEG